MRERLLLVCAAAIAFGASLGSGFHFDDYAIFSDPALTSPSGWAGVWRIGQTRPLTYLTLWMNYQAGGREPLGYHAVNLALHLAVVLLAYECLRRLLPARAALIAAAIFAAHPMQAEAVNYVWARSIVLAAAFCLLSLRAWLDGQPWRAVAWFAAALLAKEECAAFPLVLALVPPMPIQPGNGPAADLRLTARQRIAALAAAMTLSVLAAGRVLLAISATPGAPAGARAGITPWEYLLAQGGVTLRYLRMTVVPYGFTVDPEIAIPPLWVGLLAWAGIAALAALAWRRFGQEGRWVLAGLLLLLPSSSVFPAADLAADRRMYLPMLAFAAALGTILSRWKPAVAAALVLCLALVGAARTRVWSSEETLWREAVRRAPGKARPRIQLARAVGPPEALALLSEARNLAPDDAAVASEMGMALLRQNRTADALAEFGRALALAPADARNYNNRGVALSMLGQTEAARQDFLRALAIDPCQQDAHDNLRRAGVEAQSRCEAR